MEESICFLINPLSGGSEGVRLIARLESQKQTLGISVVPIDFSKLSAQIAEAKKHSIVILGGGDGTISSLLPHFIDSSTKVGILPLGTANDLSIELKVPRSLIFKSASDLVKFYQGLTPSPLTLQKLSSSDGTTLSTFSNYISVGFDAQVVTDFHHWRNSVYWKAFRGIWVNRLGYFFACLKNLFFGLSSVTITNAEGQNFYCEKCISIIFPNIRSIMGLGVSNTIGSHTDDKIECIIVRRRWEYLSMLLHYRFPYGLPQMAGSSTSWSIEGLSPNTAIQIDGEARPDIKGQGLKISALGRVEVLSVTH